MISAVDSSVILDVLADSRAFADASISALRLGAREGKLIVCECVCAEVYPAIADRERFRKFLSEWQLQFVPSTEETAVRAGEMFTELRVVRLGERQGDRVTVLSGLQTGEKVVTTPPQNMRSGDPVSGERAQQ